MDLFYEVGIEMMKMRSVFTDLESFFVSRFPDMALLLNRAEKTSVEMENALHSDSAFSNDIFL